MRDKENRPHCPAHCSVTLLTIFLAFIFWGCNNNATDIHVQDVQDVQDPTDAADTLGEEVPETQDTESAGIEFDREIMVGTWTDSSSIFEYVQRYHFYDDGTYLLEYSNHDSRKRILSESGLWDIAGDTLTLTVKSTITVEGGEEVETFSSNLWSHESLVNGKIKIIEAIPSENNRCIVNDISRNIGENTQGELTVTINGKQYDKEHPSPNAYLSREQYKDGDVYRPFSADEKTLLAGTWHDLPHMSDQSGERHHFYDNGVYLHEFSNYDHEKRVLSESGVWDFQNGILILTVNSKVTIEGGEETAEALLRGDPNKYAIVNGRIKTIDIDSPESVEYVIGNIDVDPDEMGNGYLTMKIGGMRYWRLTDDPYGYENYFLEDGEVYHPWP